MTIGTELTPTEYVIQKGWQYRRRGKWLDITRCPFCLGGKSGDLHTFAINIDDGNYVCKRSSCGVSSSFDNLRRHFGDLKDRSFQAPQKVVTEFKKPKSQLQPLSDGAVEYLHIRGFSNDTIASCGLQSDAEGNIVFVYEDMNNQTCMLKFRRPKKHEPKDGRKAWREEGGKAVLWRLNRSDPSNGPLIITFGEYDAMACVEAGALNVTSVPSGDNDTNWIMYDWEELQRYQDIILWPDKDADDAGLNAAMDIAKRLGTYKIRLVQVDFKDANAMLHKITESHDKEFARQCILGAIESAPSYPHEQVIRLVDVEDNLGQRTGLLYQVSKLDQMTGGAVPSELTLWSGDNHAGKTTGVLSVCAIPTVEQNEGIFIYSGEMKKSVIKYWFELMCAGPDNLIEHFSERTGRPYYEITPEAKTRIRKWYSDKVFLYDRYGGVNEDNLFDAMEFTYRKFGVRRFIVDNLMIMTLGFEGKDEYAKQAKFVYRFKEFCNTFDVIGDLVAHARKTGDPYLPPTKGTIKGASEISNLVDNAGAFWKVPKETPAEFLTKQQQQVWSRFREVDSVLFWFKTRDSGDEGHIELQYCKMSKRLKQVEGTRPWDYPNYQLSWNLLSDLGGTRMIAEEGDVI